MVLVGFAGVPFFSTVAHRTTKRTAMILVLSLSILAFGLTWVLYNPNYPYLQLVTAGFNAFTMAGFWMLYGAIGADVIDYDELESGKRREGAFSACGSFFMKIGLGIGMGGSGLVLTMSGFDESLGGEQSESALTLMRLFLAVIPIIGLVVALFFILRFQLTKERSQEIRNLLEERRGQIG
jgi:GPH family glycoside/pentoside/hexuronide:cation symporter